VRATTCCVLSGQHQTSVSNLHAHPVTLVLEGLPAIPAVLRAAARLALDATTAGALTSATARVEQWPTLISEVEEHGLAPLVREHATATGLELPPHVRRQLTSLAVRHREASQAHTTTLLEMVAALEGAGIRTVALKGAVLAHDLYPSPALRPRRDIDLLVSEADALRAVDVLRSLGFDDTPVQSGRARHHHLPGMSAERGGFRVSVEVHTDALSPDQPDRLPLPKVAASLRTVTIEGMPVTTLGHEDMLRHLAAHLLEPGRHTRLINVVDLVAYAERYVTVVDWERVRQANPRTIVTLGVMHYLTGLPEALAWMRPPHDVPAPQGVGAGFPMLSSIEWKRGRLASVLRELLYPSAWWMHAYYGVPPGRTLALVRWSRHAPRVVYWGARRALSARAS
jgi:hypothetical protein